MNFKYNLDKKEMRYVLYLYQSKNDLFFMIFFILFYICLIFSILKYNVLFGIFSILIFSIIMYLFLHLFNYLTSFILCKINEQKIENPYGVFDGYINESGIYEKSDKVVHDYSWKNIKKIKKYRKFYVVITNQKIMLFFRKKYFMNIDDYNKSINFIKEKIKEK